MLSTIYRGTQMQPSKEHEPRSIYTKREHVDNVVEQLNRDDPDWSYQVLESTSGKSWTIMVYDENDKFLGYL